MADRRTTPAPTIHGALRATAARVPQREALVYEDLRYTYAELDRAVDRAASVLQSRGLRKGLGFRRSRDDSAHRGGRSGR